MDRMQYVEPTRRDEILAEAIEKTTPVVVTSRTGTDWVTHRSHFLAAPGLQQHLLIAGPLTTENGALTTLTRGEQIGVSFRRGHKKCMFGSVVEDLQEYPQGVVVEWPEQLQEFQRRVYHRSTPPRGVTIEIRYWLADAHEHAAPTPPPEDACHGTLTDLSVGGARIETQANPSLRIGQTVVCHFVHRRGAPPMSLEAKCRHRQREPNGTESLGLQFVGLEATPGGRKRLVRLAQIVSEFQRSHYGTTHRHGRARSAHSG